MQRLVLGGTFESERAFNMFTNLNKSNNSNIVRVNDQWAGTAACIVLAAELVDASITRWSNVMGDSGVVAR